MNDTPEYLGKGSFDESQPSGRYLEQRGFAIKLWAAASAVFLTCSLLVGYFIIRGRNVQNLNDTQQVTQSERQSPLPPKAQIFQDEVLLKGSQAVVGGSVRNLTEETLEDLNVEIELTAHDRQTKATRTVRVEPANLRPGELGRFVLQIASSEWSGTRVARLLSAKYKGGIPFKPEIGAKRPPTRAPTPKVVIVPRPKKKGDGYLNTPDTPIRIP